MTAQPGERTVSWLDEDDPNRGTKQFAPVESVIDMTPPAEEPRSGKKSRREKPPKPQKPPKPPRGKLWRREKATQETPPRDNPPRDVTPRSGDWPAPASEDWLTTLRGPAPHQEWAEARDTKPRAAGPGPAADGGARIDRAPGPDAGPDPTPAADFVPPRDADAAYARPREAGVDRVQARNAGPGWDGGPVSADEWTDEAPRTTGPHPAWAGAPEGALDDDTAPASVRSGSRKDWFTPMDAPRDDSPHEADDPEWDSAPRRDGWDRAPQQDDRRDSEPRPDDPRDGWDRAPQQDDRWDSGRRPDDRRKGWNSAFEKDSQPRPDDRRREPEPAGRRVGLSATEPKARPDWLTSPLPAAPAAAPDGRWSEVEPQDAPSPEAWPAPLDITPDDDLDDPPPDKRRRGPRPDGGRSGPPTGGRAGGRGPRRRHKPLMLLAIALTAAVAAAAVVAAGTVYRLVFDPETPGSHTIAAPLDGRQKGELELATGAATVTVSSADLGESFFEVSTPESGDAIPLATIRGDRTTVTLASNRGEEASAVEIRLNARVPWRLVFKGGAQTQSVDFSAGRLSGLEMTGGATRLELTLPKPAGTVPIQLRGGLKELLVHAPRGVLTRVKVTKGATNVTLDRLNREKVAPDTTFTPNGWAQAKTRYDIDAAEGIGTVKLDRR